MNESSRNMQREREGSNDFFRESGFERSMFPSLFGGRSPFDDPFFSRPLGSLFDSSMFNPSAACGAAQDSFIEKGITIEELNSDDEEEQGNKGPEDNNENDRNQGEASRGPSVEHPDDMVNEEREGNVILRNEPYKMERPQPQLHRYNVQTCKVTYGGVDGAYYSSTRTRRAGSDGVVIEETKEADKTTRQAAHKISRGIRDKGHSVTRKLNADGKVDTSQTLHNLNEDELAGFEEAWNSNAKGGMAGWRDRFDMHGSGRSEQKGDSFMAGWLLPSLEGTQKTRGTAPHNEARAKKVVRINIE
ncbi:uncharacterized protein LOC115706805 isoform X3 [Cannabis sativa]|uniref:uncharacterized protein LOC115706805 isoform X3 n=1 Tax=Cannabis sativa TaxID=3483 RepID=UPI0029CA2B67|nr:uncharacterized protein LOC115706805 isoform X3 [Cannabis sativa]